jgi:hypothetical protein
MAAKGESTSSRPILSYRRENVSLPAALIRHDIVIFQLLATPQVGKAGGVIMERYGGLWTKK